MRDIKQARSLLRMAQKDFTALNGMARDSVTFADEIFGFHAQQAVEKGLKAWICLHGIEYPYTHQIGRLITILEQAGEDMDIYLSLDQYTVFSVLARYEEGDAALDEPLNREGVIAEISFLLEKVDVLLSQSEVIDEGA
jgi:HEPN domain-containing protein